MAATGGGQPAPKFEPVHRDGKVAYYEGPPRDGPTEGTKVRGVRCPNHCEHKQNGCMQSWSLRVGVDPQSHLDEHLNKCMAGRGASADGHAPGQGPATGPKGIPSVMPAISEDTEHTPIKQESPLDEATEVACVPAGVQVPAPQAWPAVPPGPERCDAQLAQRRAERGRHERVVEALLVKQAAAAEEKRKAKKDKEAEPAPDAAAPAAEKAADAQAAGASGEWRARATRLWQLRETVMLISHLFCKTPVVDWDAHWEVEVAKFDDSPTEAWPVRTCIKEKRTHLAWTIPWKIPEGRGAHQERETGTLSSKDHRLIKWLVLNRRDLNEEPGGIAMSELEETVFDRIKRALNAMETKKELKTAKRKRKRTGDNAEGGEAHGSVSGRTPAA